MKTEIKNHRQPELVWSLFEQSLKSRKRSCKVQVVSSWSVDPILNRFSLFELKTQIFPSFCCRFLDMVTQHFGSVAASTVRGFGAEQYPLLLVAMKNRSAMEICSVLQGTNYCCFCWFKYESGNEGLPAFRELVNPKLSINFFNDF